ncbi:hypothetical protein Scep_006214 [Stephania cephalantha]|uniref:Uncharacterized protein n=1 Tax=Stephania cephalantha TaxID=152367 RepID=A0AAP0PKL9_9MAGN
MAGAAPAVEQPQTRAVADQPQAAIGPAARRWTAGAPAGEDDGLAGSGVAWTAQRGGVDQRRLQIWRELARLRGADGDQRRRRRQRRRQAVAPARQRRRGKRFGSTAMARERGGATQRGGTAASGGRGGGRRGRRAAPAGGGAMSARPAGQRRRQRGGALSIGWMRDFDEITTTRWSGSIDKRVVVTVYLRYELLSGRRRYLPIECTFEALIRVCGYLIVARVRAGRHGTRPKPESAGIFPRLNDLLVGTTCYLASLIDGLFTVLYIHAFIIPFVLFA